MNAEISWLSNEFRVEYKGVLIYNSLANTLVVDKVFMFLDNLFTNVGLYKGLLIISTMYNTYWLEKRE